MNYRKSIIIILFINIVSSCKSQEISEKNINSMLNLSIEQMYQDFDSLEFITKSCFQFSEVNKKIYKIDINEIFEKNRKKIQEINKASDFGILINKTINSCRGSHFWIAAGKEKDSITNAYYSYLKQEQNLNKTKNAFFYYKGSYYTKTPLKISNITIPVGSKVVFFNNKSIDEFLKTVIADFSFAFWDNELKKFYMLDFYNHSSVKNKINDYFFETPDKKQIKIRIKSTQLMQKDTNIYPLITLLKNENILYLRFPEMSIKYANILCNGIDSLKNKDFKSIVIDIRNNGGGTDDAWGILLIKILGKPIRYRLKAGINNSDFNKKIIAKYPYDNYFLQGNHEKIEFLNNEEFLTISAEQETETDSLNINFEGKIYVLSDNIYSSAGSFMNLCNFSDKLISVGFDNSLVLGMGVQPYEFTLPSSKIKFHIAPAIDLTNAKNALETLHIKVEHQINSTKDDYIKYYLNNKNIENDLFIKEVIKLMKE
jgi:hypothetical protein